MNIGYDAKRAFFNRSGLGNYSRNTILIQNQYFPENKYYLYTPKIKGAISFIKAENIQIITPESFLFKAFKPLWRSYGISRQLKADKIDLYHGLSNELPFNIYNTGIKSVVTIHDLIFLRYPENYKTIDRKIYEKKFKYSSEIADKVISISQQTKADLINFFRINPEKIEVVYQGCDPIFYKIIEKDKKRQIIEKLGLPKQYILYVGTIEKRKNLLSLVEAIDKGKIDIPLVVVGKPTVYASIVKSYISKNDLKNVFFLENLTLENLAALYQAAEVFIYPSVFEGFGLPILEALNSRVPVITTIGGCFSETGGVYTKYIDPFNTDEFIDAIKVLLTDSGKKEKIIKEGYRHALKFREDKIAAKLMDVYKKVLG
ncbi:MAG: glycosyltransferase family 4 protein [Bacteroidales bacterium]|nr:glycosyltransferase family 4 protein [Bacteroidales bacterium]